VNAFHLHPRLEADTVFVADWPLCAVRLMRDSRYPWLILVPRPPAAVEIHAIATDDRALLMEEAARASRVLAGIRGIEKVNIAALGNQVAQLHVHVIGRRRGDPAWPGPVWGHGAPKPYGAREQAEIIALVRSC
jgi:diadenosine tetraphosphate (Ap4A) HIT family hydrolase